MPALIRVGEMAASVAALAALHARPSVLARLTSWDATYYADIARFGYPHHVVVSGDHLADGARFAFSPLLPLLTAAVHAAGLSVRSSQVLVAEAAGIVASIGVYLLARELGAPRRAGYVAVALIGALPMALSLQMGYAESLAMALGAFSLRATVRAQWWWAGALALFAGLARPSGGIVALAIAVAAWAARRSRAVAWRHVVGATVLGVAGLPLFWIYVWARTGVADGWFVVQRIGWHTRFDFGAATLEFLTANTVFGNNVVAVGVLVSFVLYGVAALVAVRAGGSRPLLVVAFVAVALTVGSSNFWYSKPRLLLAAFPLVVLVARPISRMRTAPLVTALVIAVGLSTWWSAYALTRWPYTI